MEYLNATKLLKPARKELGLQALKEGIDKIMQTRHSDKNKKNHGAFSVWGRDKTQYVYKWDVEKDSSSIWLTAYITKLLGRAKHWTQVQDKIIFEALKFLKSKQEPDGKFTEYGPISVDYLQSDSAEGVPLTAFTVIAFLENKDYITRYNDTIKKSLDFLDRKSTTLEDNYALAITFYALVLGGRKDNLTQLIETLDRNSFYDGISNTKFWEKELKVKKGSTPASIKAEIAAYVILAYVKIGKAVDAIPIVNWLVAQRNSGGGFLSTQDTVISLQALTSVAEILYYPQLNMELKLNFTDNENKIFKITNENRLTLQTKSLPLNFKSINFSAKGSGIASFQVAYNYIKFANETINIFNLQVHDISESDSNILKLQVCASYVVEESSDLNRTGMAIIEVELPSGYVVDQNFDLHSNENVKVKN